VHPLQGKRRIAGEHVEDRLRAGIVIVDQEHANLKDLHGRGVSVLQTAGSKPAGIRQNRSKYRRRNNFDERRAGSRRCATGPDSGIFFGFGRSGYGAAGTVSVNTLPPAGIALTTISPRICRARSRAMARPRPIGRSRRVAASGLHPDRTLAGLWIEGGADGPALGRFDVDFAGFTDVVLVVDAVGRGTIVDHRQFAILPPERSHKTSDVRGNCRWIMEQQPGL